MLQVDMTAQVRKDFGKGAMRSLRRDGQTPAVLYGPQIEPLALAFETKMLSKELLKIHGQNAVLTLSIKGSKSKKKRHVMIKEIQTDPIHDTLLHADLMEISLKKETALPVPIRLLGTPKGVDMGGVLYVQHEKVLLKGLPLDIPDFLEADVTSLELDGPGLTCKELVIPEKVTLEEDLDMVCASVIKPSRAAEEEVSAEPEEGEEKAAADAEGESPSDAQEGKPDEEADT